MLRKFAVIVQLFIFERLDRPIGKFDLTESNILSFTIIIIKHDK